MREKASHLGLIPLDERPANTRYPAMIAASAGADLRLPPLELLSAYRIPARHDALADWLRDNAADLDVLIVSLEMLGYGGLIASRTTAESAGAVLARLDLLRDLKRRHPDLTIYGFNLITRIPDYNGDVEEPPYWKQYGKALSRFSQLSDRALQGRAAADELAALRASIPAEHVTDFLWRRIRNHTVNLAALQMAAEGVFDLLVLSSDDTVPYGLASREKRWLAEWADRLTLGDRLLMYPGADEVGAVLTARVINVARSFTPRFAVSYAVPGGEDVVAPYEDGPVKITVERQVRAVGGTVTDGKADFFLAVNTPVERRGEFDPAYAEDERSTRLPYLVALVKEIARRQAQGEAVIVVDVAYPNGSDPVLIDLLREHIQLPELAAYGGWNTAANTIGTALAQACAARWAEMDVQRQAQERFLLHRFVEDWGYQHLVRAEIRAWLEAETGIAEATPATLADVQSRIADRLQALIAELPGFAGRWRMVPGSVRLPWARTFEVDFDLEPLEPC